MDDFAFRVSSAASAARVALVERDVAIRAWREAGGSLRVIGAAAGLTHSGVARICDGRRNVGERDAIK